MASSHPRPPRPRSRGSAAGEVPAELRIFGDGRFDAAEYVTGVCREASTAASFASAERKLESLRGVARASLLRGDDAESFGNAGRKILATLREVRDARDALDAAARGLDAYEAEVRAGAEPRSPLPA